MAVSVTLEIAAEIPSGVPDNVVRVVTEDSRDLKFDSHGSESDGQPLEGYLPSGAHHSRCPEGRHRLPIVRASDHTRRLETAERVGRLRPGCDRRVISYSDSSVSY